MGIQRWGKDGVDYRLVKSNEGHFVMFTDHEQVVAELESSLTANLGIINTAMDQITKLAIERDALRAELAAKSKEVDRLNRVVDAYKDYKKDIDSVIDSAMGEGNGR